jgi:hypothetical protein
MEKTVAAKGIHKIIATLRVGDLRVRTDLANTVRVRGTWRFDLMPPDQVRAWTKDSQLTLERQGDTLLIRDKTPDSLAQNLTGRFPDLVLELEIPPRLALELSLSFGQLEVTGEVGDLAAETNIGDVRLRNLRCTGEQATVKVAVGDAWIAPLSLPRGTLRAEVGVGRAAVQVPPGTKASVTATTSAGRIASRLPLSSPQHKGSVLGETLTGALNGGGPLLQVDVSTGDAQFTLAATDQSPAPR